MGYEVDFFPVSTGGAAVLVRWGTPGDYKLLVYDGGTLATGQRLVKHIREHCFCSHVDYVVSSHPAPQRAEGLRPVLEQFSVGEFWTHRPWLHTARPEAATESVRELEQLALDRKIPVHEPFAGAVIGPFTVLSPNRSWYLNGLLPALGSALPSAGLTLADVARWAHAAGAGIVSRWDFEPLPYDPAIHVEHESSAVLYGEFEGRGVLLTSDAGVRALGDACSFAEHLGLALPSNLRLMQVPGDGRPDHLSSRVLDRLIGERQPRERRSYGKTAFISAPEEALPRGYRIVIDALMRRGAMSYMTQGSQFHHAYEMPERSWLPAVPVRAKG